MSSPLSVRSRILRDISVDALTAPTAVYELRSSLSVLCGTASCSSLVCFPGGFDPSYLSFPKVCPGTVVCCLWSRVLWPVSCTRVAPVFTWLVLCTLRVFLVDHGEQFFKWKRYVSLRPLLHVPGFWNAMGVASGELSSLLFSGSHEELSSAVLLVCGSAPPCQ